MILHTSLCRVVANISVHCCSVIASRPFQFFIGPKGKLFTIHAALLEHVSKPLAILVSGPMVEAKDGSATLDDLDESTFVRFSQYAYTGDYDTAEPDIILDSSMIHPGDHNAAGSSANVKLPAVAAGSTAMESAPEQSAEPVTEPSETATSEPTTEESDLTRPIFDPGMQGKPSSLPISYMWQNFLNMRQNVPKAKSKVRRNREACEDYTEVFLCHARLYVFAEKYDIRPLRKLALHKLQRTLSVFIVYKDRIGDLTSLIRYSYDNTSDLENSSEPLRDMISQYAASVLYRQLAFDKQFQETLKDYGSFGKDILVHLVPVLDDISPPMRF